MILFATQKMHALSQRRNPQIVELTRESFFEDADKVSLQGQQNWFALSVSSVVTGKTIIDERYNRVRAVAITY